MAVPVHDHVTIRSVNLHELGQLTSVFLSTLRIILLQEDIGFL